MLAAWACDVACTTFVNESVEEGEAIERMISVGIGEFVVVGSKFSVGVCVRIGWELQPIKNSRKKIMEPIIILSFMSFSHYFGWSA